MSDNTREKAVEAAVVNARMNTVAWSAIASGDRLTPDDADRFIREIAVSVIGVLYQLGWSPSPVPMVDREALASLLHRLIWGREGPDAKSADGLADAILASNILRPLPTEEEIAETIYAADEAWYAEDPKSGRGLSVRAWSRWMAKRVLALLKGES